MNKFIMFNFPDITKPSLPMRLQISMDSKLCAGAYFYELARWCIRCKPPTIIIQVSDSLHRHNLIWQKSISVGRAHRGAVVLGDRWIEENRVALEAIACSKSQLIIERWDQILNYPEYVGSRKAVEAIFKRDKKLREIVLAEIKSYFQRSRRTSSDGRVLHAIDYIVEEISASEACARRMTTHEIYPGARFLPEEYVANRYLSSLSLGKQEFVTVPLVVSEFGTVGTDCN